MVIGVGVSYLYVSCGGSIKREPIFLLSFNCKYVVSVRRGFLFLFALDVGCAILLWQSLGLPYNYFTKKVCYVT